MYQTGGFSEKRSLCVFLPFILITVCGLLFCLPAAWATDKAPEGVQAALFVKLLAFHKNLQPNISIHVISSPSLAGELRDIIGEKIGNATLTEVTESNSVPEKKPFAVYVGDASKKDEAIRYTREQKILSMTGLPELVSEGVTLGVGISDGKPKILLNVAASKAEEIQWDITIMKIAETY